MANTADACLTDDCAPPTDPPLPATLALDRRSRVDRRQRTEPVLVDRRQHGERRSYQLGCRCTQCRAANARYQAAFRLAKVHGRPLLGSRVPAARLHKWMLVLRLEQFTNGDVARLLGWRGNYGRVYHARTVAFRTQLQVFRLYRDRVLVSPN